MAWPGAISACPHTAVALCARTKLGRRRSTRPLVTLATAHPAKFPDTVEKATGARPPLPPQRADLFQREEKFDTLAADADTVKALIRERSRAWQ